MNPPDIENDGPDWPARIRHFMELTKLSYSIVIMEKGRIFGVRDPYGNRPLCIGKLMSLTDPSKGKFILNIVLICNFILFIYVILFLYIMLNRGRLGCVI